MVTFGTDYQVSPFRTKQNHELIRMQYLPFTYDKDNNKQSATSLSY